MIRIRIAKFKPANAPVNIEPGEAEFERLVREQIHLERYDAQMRYAEEHAAREADRLTALGFVPGFHDEWIKP